MNSTFNRFVLLVSTITLTMTYGGLSAKAETVNPVVEGAIATSQTPSARLDLSALQPDLPETSSSGLGIQPLEINGSTWVQPGNSASTRSVDIAQTGSGGTLGTPSTPNQPPLETNPVSPGSGTNLPNPLDPTPGGPGRLDQDTSTQDPRTPGLSTPDSTLPETTVPNPATPEPTPNSTVPDPSVPETTPPGASSQAEPDRTPPGTFTPDTTGVSPGRVTRSGPSYIGVGGNIGLGSGDTALGEGSFSIFSKIGLTSNLSVRPNVLISDDPTILLPITLDFIPLITRVTEDLSNRVGLNVSPYLGAGVAISTGDDGSVDFLATGGVDVPINDRITATAAVNATLFDNPAVGLVLGVGYNF